MQFIIYILLYPILWCISILPFRLLYVVSDGFYFLTYYIIGYRKKIVRENLALTLSHLSDKERLIIEKKTYQNMCDVFLEMIKTLTISKSEMERRFKFKNIEVYLDLEKKGKSIALLCAHYAVYKRINNRYFDKLVRDIRSKFKATLITTKETIPTMENNFKNNKPSLYGLVSDQSPRLDSVYHWNKFMGIEVPIHTGGEMLAKKYDMNILFLRTKKLGRGFYEAELEILSENTKEVPDYEITDRFLKLVEQQIYEQPENYLWTHKRWKHRKLS